MRMTDWIMVALYPSRLRPQRQTKESERGRERAGMGE